MGMFLLLIGLSVVFTALQGVVVWYMWRESRAPRPAVDAAAVVGPPKFFQVSVGPAVTPAYGNPQIPLLLQRLEQHIRLEQAAAESFHQFPTAASLHSHSASPLLH